MNINAVTYFGIYYYSQSHTYILTYRYKYIGRYKNYLRLYNLLKWHKYANDIAMYAYVLCS